MKMTGESSNIERVVRLETLMETIKKTVEDTSQEVKVLAESLYGMEQKIVQAINKASQEFDEKYVHKYELEHLSKQVENHESLLLLLRNILLGALAAAFFAVIGLKGLS